MIKKNIRHILAQVDQFRARIKPEDLKIEEELGKDEEKVTCYFESKTKPGMEESINEYLKKKNSRKINLELDHSLGETKKDTTKNNLGSRE